MTENPYDKAAERADFKAHNATLTQDIEAWKRQNELLREQVATERAETARLREELEQERAQGRIDAIHTEGRREIIRALEAELEAARAELARLRAELDAVKYLSEGRRVLLRECLDARGVDWPEALIAVINQERAQLEAARAELARLLDAAMVARGYIDRERWPLAWDQLNTALTAPPAPADESEDT